MIQFSENIQLLCQGFTGLLYPVSRWDLSLDPTQDEGEETLLVDGDSILRIESAISYVRLVSF